MPDGDEAEEPREEGANWMVKNNKPHYGYKVHLCTDENDLVVVHNLRRAAVIGEAVWKVGA